MGQKKCPKNRVPENDPDVPGTSDIQVEKCPILDPFLGHVGQADIQNVGHFWDISCPKNEF